MTQTKTVSAERLTPEQLLDWASDENNPLYDYDRVPDDLIAGCIALAKELLASRHQEPVNEPGEAGELQFQLDRLNAWFRELWTVKDIDLHMSDGTIRRGQSGLLSNIRDDVRALRRAVSIPKPGVRASTIFQAIRGHLDPAASHADVMSAIESTLEPSTSEGEEDGRVEIIEQSDMPDGGTALTLRQYDQETVVKAYFPPVVEPTPVSPLPVGVMGLVEVTREQAEHLRLGLSAKYPDVRNAAAELLNRVDVLLAALSAKPTGEE